MVIDGRKDCQWTRSKEISTEKAGVICLTESVYNIKSMRNKTDYYNH